MIKFKLSVAILSVLCSVSLTCTSIIGQSKLKYQSLPSLPDPIGVAGPIVGVHNGGILVAGGANFARRSDPQLWDVDKKYMTNGYVFSHCEDLDRADWEQSFSLSMSVGYSAVASTDLGVLVLGGHNETNLTRRAFLLTYDRETGKVTESDEAIPDLPMECTEGGAAVIGDFVYVVAGNVIEKENAEEKKKKVPSSIVWRLNYRQAIENHQRGEALQTSAWQRLPDLPGPPREFPLVVAQHNGFRECLFVIGGRRFEPGTDKSDLNNLTFFDDVFVCDMGGIDFDQVDQVNGEFAKQAASPWQKKSPSPVPVSAGTAVRFGQAHLLVLGYADGSVIRQFLEAKKRSGRSDYSWKDFDHPGFPTTAYRYHAITDRWTDIGEMPVNQVTTPAVVFNDRIVVVSGEVRPRVRTRNVWSIQVPESKSDFGWINMSVVVVYLLLIVAVGLFFTFKNRSVDDYFRAGKNVHWFVAGCSIYATMLSSITYMAVPAKAFAQDWVYIMGNVMILAVAPIAIYVALPFFRKIDATSAYEYLELRYSRLVRQVGSATFALFHVFRMGVVLALASLALASVTPLTAAQCVVVMGVLSIIYCTLGGIEAVLWTDTIQTFVLLGGALLCLWFAWLGTDSASLQAAVEHGKFHTVNFDLDPSHFTTMTILVVVVGGFGQNLSSYTADQAVVQRYMTTPSTQQASRSIWLNGLMAIPSGVIFFGLGTALWMFYHAHPEKLDPTISNDRILPLFISQELPIGLAGLVVAGIFAAAQSTVSTSMNSGATAIVTDFILPGNGAKTQSGEGSRQLTIARLLTFVMGLAGTVTGFWFVNPTIKSLFDEFIGLLGIFLGVLAGLFALGALTRRANSIGGLVGALVSLSLMSVIYLGSKGVELGFIKFANVSQQLPLGLGSMHGYLYAITGIVTCFVVGYVVSLLFPRKADLAGLTIWHQGISKEV